MTTYQEWHNAYLSPFMSDDDLRTRIEEHGGFDGWVLDGVLAVKDIDGQEITDNECLEIIQVLINNWHEANNRGFE